MNNTPSFSSEKNQLRTHLRKARRALTPQQQLNAARKLFWHCAKLREFKRAKKIAFYLAHDGEISLHFILRFALRQRKQCFLPQLDKDHLLFRRYYSAFALRKNRFGIAEPGARTPRLHAEQLDLVFLPLVGWDGHGHRLGMGGGYYDRSFAFRKCKRRAAPLLIGVGHQLQKVAQLHNDHWDVPLDMVLSDRELLRLRP